MTTTLSPKFADIAAEQARTKRLAKIGATLSLCEIARLLPIVTVEYLAMLRPELVAGFRLKAAAVQEALRESIYEID